MGVPPKKIQKQAGTVLGQAQLKLELELELKLCFTSFKICCIKLIKLAKLDLVWSNWFGGFSFVGLIEWICCCIFGFSHLTHFAWWMRFSFVNLVW